MSQVTTCWTNVNRRCNFRCPWCYVKETGYQPKDSMSWELAQRTAYFLRDIGVQSNLQIGGEPTLWPHVFDYAALSKQLGMEAGIITNGYMCGDPKFAQQLEVSAIDLVDISLKAATAKQHAAVTRASEDSFHQVLAGIRNVSGMPRIEMEVSLVASDTSLPTVVDMMRIAIENGAPNVVIDFCSVTFDATNNPVAAGMVPPQRLIRFFADHYQQMVDVTGGKFVVNSFLPACLWPNQLLATMLKEGQISFGCHVMNQSGLILSPAGEVLVCNHMHEFPIGKLGVDFDDPASFERFWTKPEITTIYDQLMAYPVAQCSQCGDYMACGGGCPLSWFVYKPSDVIPEGVTGGRIC